MAESPMLTILTEQELHAIGEGFGDVLATEDCTLVQCDCLVGMEYIPDGSVDMILCDLPYGTTACKWDVVIPFEPLWAQYKRVIKRNGAIVLTASQPFATEVIVSNRMWFRYELIWDKVNLFTNHINAHKMPMKQHENILVFYESLPAFNKQSRNGKPYSGRGCGTVQVYDVAPRNVGNSTGLACPASIIQIPGLSAEPRGLHPTQKPVALGEYLIRTYTNEGELVLDNCMGSGSFGVAAVKCGRRFVGFEKDVDRNGNPLEYCAIAKRRIQEALMQPRLTLVDPVPTPINNPTQNRMDSLFG